MLFKVACSAGTIVLNRVSIFLVLNGDAIFHLVFGVAGLALGHGGLAVAAIIHLVAFLAAIETVPVRKIEWPLLGLGFPVLSRILGLVSVVAAIGLRLALQACGTKVQMLLVCIEQVLEALA